MSNLVCHFSEYISVDTFQQLEWLKAMCVFLSDVRRGNVLHDTDSIDTYLGSTLVSEGFGLVGDYLDVSDVESMFECFPESNEELNFSFDYQDEGFSPHRVLIHTDGITGPGGSVDEAAYLVKLFLSRFRPQEVWHMNFSVVLECDGVSKFGGGAVGVTAKEVVYMDPTKWLAENRFSPGTGTHV